MPDYNGIMKLMRMQDHDAINTGCPPQTSHETFAQAPFPADNALQQPVNKPFEGAVEGDSHLPPSHVHQERPLADPLSEAGLGGAPLEALDADFWANETDSYWPFMPFLSQLETLPPDLDLSNMQ